MPDRTSFYYRSCLLLLLLACATAVSAQERHQSNQRALNYGFVSPNTRNDLKLDEAINGMASTAEWNLIRQSRRLGCVVKSKIQARPSLGSWSDGAEFSVLVRVDTDESTVRYLMARLGSAAGQKSVLYFHPQAAGAAIIYELRPRKNLRLNAIVRILDRAGIAFRTLVPVGRETIVYVVDLKRELTSKLNQAARRLHAEIRSQVGNAEFVGDETAAQAKTVFEKEVKAYESSHPNLPSPCH